MEEPKWFFDNMRQDVYQQITSLDISKYKLYHGPLLPGEEVIGELETPEKQILIWISLTDFEMLWVRPSEEDLQDLERIKQYNAELENLAKERRHYLDKVAHAIVKKFDRAPLDIRRNFKVVACNRSAEEVRAFIAEMEEAPAFLNLGPFNTGRGFVQ
jgi:hypothetical protein